jgi:hypothetical protein
LILWFISKFQYALNVTKPGLVKDERASLIELNKTSKNNNCFTIGGEASDLPSQPGIFIKSLGTIISLPLNKYQAEEIIRDCTSPPSSVAKIQDPFSLDTTEFNIKNPDWELKLKELTTRVGSYLGINGSIQPKISSLILFKPGDTGLQRTEIENHGGKDNCGTLIVQLPSIYSGGELLVYNERKKFTHDFGQTTKKSAFNVHFAAFYANINHELMPVTDGYRIVLIYSLNQTKKSSEYINNSGTVISKSGFMSNIWYLFEVIRLSFLNLRIRFFN